MPDGRVNFQLCLILSDEEVGLIKKSSYQTDATNKAMSNFEISALMAWLQEISINNNQFQRMWSIREEDNESNTEEEFPIQLGQIGIAKLRLVKIGASEGEDDSAESQIDLDGYLETQRLGTTKNQPRKRQKTQEERQIQREYSQGYGIGFKLLQSMGFTNVTKGLGKNEQGRTNIVEAQFKTALTARDNDEPQDEGVSVDKQKDSEERQLEAIQENEQKYNEFKFQEIFTYRSKIPQFHRFLLALRNQYQTLQAKLNIYQKETDSFTRDMEISNDLKLQKCKQLQAMDEEIQGLSDISANESGIYRHPHLGLTYNCDLLALRQSIEGICNFQLQKIGPYLKTEVRKLEKILTNMYLAKEKEALSGYYQNSSGKSLFQQRVKAYLNSTGSKSAPGFFSNSSGNDPEIAQEIKLSQQDSEKIRKFIKILIEETVIRNKLETYLSSKKDISQCDRFVIDLLENIQVHNAQILKQLKEKYLVPLANRYLRNFDPSKSISGMLPYHVVFPWLQILRLQNLDLDAFLFQVCRKVWDVTNSQLYDFLEPWLKHMPSQKTQFFIKFYLAPRLLREMESFPLGVQGQQKTVKRLLQGFKKYFRLFEYLPTNTTNFQMRSSQIRHFKQNMLQNTLLLKILQVYRKESQNNNSKADMQKWVLRWETEIDEICSGAMRKFFADNGINYQEQ